MARYAGLTGSPNMSGNVKRERGLAKSGNARVRRGLIQLAWCFVRFQKGSALVQWYLAQVEGGKRKVSMITAHGDHWGGSGGTDIAHAGCLKAGVLTLVLASAY